MGGLKNRIPITYATMFIGAVAISGIPPWPDSSRRTRSWARHSRNGFVWVWAIGLLVAAMTAFYMFRLIGLTFWGKSRVDPDVAPHIQNPAIHADPIDPARHPHALAWPGGWAGRRRAVCSTNGWRRCSARRSSWRGIRRPRTASSRLDGALLITSVALATLGILAAWRLFGVDFAGLRRAGNPDRVRALAARSAVPLSRIAEQMVVRRPV